MTKRLQHLSYKDSLTELGLFKPGGEKAWWDLSTLYKYLMRGNKKMKPCSSQ